MKTMKEKKPSLQELQDQLDMERGACRARVEHMKHALLDGLMWGPDREGVEPYQVAHLAVTRIKELEAARDRLEQELYMVRSTQLRAKEAPEF